MMGWKNKLVVGLAAIITPVKLVGKGFQSVKEDFQDEIKNYSHRLKMMVLMVLVTVFFLLFLSISLAIWIGYWMENLGIGFIVVTGIYLVATLIIYFKKRNEFI